MTRCWSSMMKKVRATFTTATSEAITSKRGDLKGHLSTRADAAFYSKQPQILQINLRPHHNLPPLGRYQRSPFLSAILVCKATHVLDTARLGAELRRVDPCVSESANREC